MERTKPKKGILNEDGLIAQELNLSSDEVVIELSPEIMEYKNEILTVLLQSTDKPHY